MTIHRLTTHGARRTCCGLKVPDVIDVKPTATTWNDGDGSLTSLCFGGCYALRDEKPTTGPLKRYDVFSSRKVKGETIWIRAGVAFESRERNGDLVVQLDVLPIEGVLTLRLAKEAA